ncbi:YfhO family protein, partial [Candidatus Binatia bacterium]|nr:YfhO family protein [Candidatus Binatia bacterium]
MSRESVLDLAVFAALAVGTLVFWQFRIVQTGYELAAPSNDLFMQIYPMSHRAFAWWRDGQIPLWNPFQYCGVPLLATVLYGIFYPLNVFYLLVPRTEVAIECTVVLHLFAAGLFMYLYCRTIRLGRWAAVAGAVVFMWSGFLVLEALWFTPALSAAVWLPLGFLAIEKIFSDRRLRWAVLLATAVAMPLLAGWLQTWLYSMYALAAYSAVRLTAAWFRPGERRHLVRLGGLLAAGAAIGLGLTAVQLLPTLELQSLGPRRPGGLSIAQMLAYGPVAPGKLLAETVDSRAGHPRFSYLGILPLLLAPLAFCTRGDRVRVAFLWCVLLLSAGFALTVHTPLFSLYRALPAATWFRIPNRILFLYAFAGAVLSGIGLDTVMSAARDRPGRRRWWVLGPILLPGVFWLLAVNMPGRSRLYAVAGVIGIAAVLLLGP